jgi:putative NADH-flavin reductase
MNLTVLGGAGATGTPLVEQALTAGHHVTALVRSPEKLTITNPSLHAVHGDATDRAAVSHAMKGADAVISTLGAIGRVPSAGRSPRVEPGQLLGRPIDRLPRDPR